MMKKMKILSVVLCVAMLASCGLTGCFGGDEGSGDKKEVRIGVEAKGYGSDFAYKLAEAYNKTQDKVEAKVVKATSQAGLHTNQLALGASKNKYDLFFTLTQSVFATQNQANKEHWADLSDVYDSVAEGYVESDGTKTIEDLMDSTYVSQFTYKDGKQYSIPYTSGAVGLLYNKTKWDATNAKLESAGKATLTLPNTTNEMFALFDQINTTEVKTASEGAYPFSYSGLDSYMHFMFNSLWPQYMGETEAKNFLEGKDGNGVYTADIYKSKGREYAYEVVREMILKDGSDGKAAYVKSTDSAQQYNQEQLAFMKGQAFFSCNGDWLEREVSKNFKPGDADVEMIRTPILSKIVENDKIKADFTGTAAEKDAKLSAIVSFIDENYIDADGEPTEADAASLGVTLSTLKFIQHARLVRHALIDFVAVIPEYSSELAEAKDFLKFMYSKAGQDIVLQATYGCAAPMKIDYSQMDYWKTGTYYSKSRLELISKCVPYGNANNFPMQYLASTRLYPVGNDIPTYFGGDNPESAAFVMMKEYDTYAGTWEDKMELAGVKNN